MVEQQFDKEKKRLEEMSAPVELEDRLRNALATTNRKPKHKFPIWKSVAVALLLFSFIGYNYNAFAYYGKKFFGFDDLMTTTLQEINDEGLGQAIEETMILEDGTELTIEGIITDANRTIIYYTLTNPNGLDLQDNYFWPYSITGLFTNASIISGTSSLSESKTEIKGTYEFEPVSPFAKNLTINLHGYDEGISFPYNPKLALQTQLKTSINKTILVDKGKIRFDKLVATQTMTIVEGILNVDNFDRVQLGLYGIDLLANGEKIEILGSGARSSIRGTKFEIRYDALPTQLDSLELVVRDFVGYQTIGETYQLNETSHLLGEKELFIQNIEATTRGLEIRIATDEDVLLDGVYIRNGSEQVELKTIANQTTEEIGGREMKVRTMIFETDIKPEYLHVEGIHYVKQYNERFVIPVK